tara:strand:- start:522 stop:680 length:159 start_codon:yes stop_codon:yes gene_type:complete
MESKRVLNFFFKRLKRKEKMYKDEHFRPDVTPPTLQENLTKNNDPSATEQGY